MGGVCHDSPVIWLPRPPTDDKTEPNSKHTAKPGSPAQVKNLRVPQAGLIDNRAASIANEHRAIARDGVARQLGIVAVDLNFAGARFDGAGIATALIVRYRAGMAPDTEGTA